MRLSGKLVAWRKAYRNDIRLGRFVVLKFLPDEVAVFARGQVNQARELARRDAKSETTGNACDFAMQRILYEADLSYWGQGTAD